MALSAAVAGPRAEQPPALRSQPHLADGYLRPWPLLSSLTASWIITSFLCPPCWLASRLVQSGLPPKETLRQGFAGKHPIWRVIREVEQGEGKWREEESQYRMHSGVGYCGGQQGCSSAGPSGRLCRLHLRCPAQETRELGYLSPNTHPALTKAVPGVGLRVVTLQCLQPACSLTWAESTAAICR